MTSPRRAVASPSRWNRRSAILWVICLMSLGLGFPAKGQDPIPATDLSTRYHLVENFTTKDPKGANGAIGQSQVVFREKISFEGIKADPYTRLVRFSERPSAISPIDDRLVSELVRHYKSMQVEPDTWKPSNGRKPLDDLLLWCRINTTKETSLIVVQAPNRSLTEGEHELILTHDFVTRLTFVLNDTPVRVGDSWAVSSNGMEALTDLPDIQEGKLTARLKEIVPHPKAAGRLVATIDVSGRVFQPGGIETAMRAEVHFSFIPVKNPASGDVAVTDGFGFVEKVILSQTRGKTATGMTQKQSIKRELLLERRVPGDAAILAIPEPPPTPTPANSWLTVADPKGQYYFRHSQRFEIDRNPNLPNGKARDPNFLIMQSVQNAKMANSFPDLVQFIYNPSGAIRPDTVFQQLKEDWKTNGVVVIEGLTHRLPEVDWPGMAVHHLEAALTQEEGAPQANARRYVDAYVIQFPRNVTLLITATTFTEEREEFRKEVEAMLKTIKLGSPITP